MPLAAYMPGEIPLPGNGDTWIVDQDPSVARASGRKRLRRGDAEGTRGDVLQLDQDRFHSAAPAILQFLRTGRLPDGFCCWRRGLVGLRSGTPGHDPRQLARAFARLALRRLSGPGAGRSPIPIHTVARGTRANTGRRPAPGTVGAHQGRQLVVTRLGQSQCHGRLLHVANPVEPQCLAQPASILTRRHPPGKRKTSQDPGTNPAVFGVPTS